MKVPADRRAAGTVKKHIVRLTAAQRDQLTSIVRRGQHPAYVHTHALILLKTDQGPLGESQSDLAIAAAVGCDDTTVARLRSRFCQDGFEAALTRKTQLRRRAPAIDGRAEAQLIALERGGPPAGHARWTLRLLAARLVELGVVERVSHEAVRQTLKKTRSSHIRSSAG